MQRSKRKGPGKGHSDYKVKLKMYDDKRRTTGHARCGTLKNQRTIEDISYHTHVFQFKYTLYNHCTGILASTIGLYGRTPNVCLK